MVIFVILVLMSHDLISKNLRIQKKPRPSRSTVFLSSGNEGQTGMAAFTPFSRITFRNAMTF